MSITPYRLLTDISALIRTVPEPMLSLSAIRSMPTTYRRRRGLPRRLISAHSRKSNTHWVYVVSAIFERADSVHVVRHEVGCFGIRNGHVGSHNRHGCRRLHPCHGLDLRVWGMQEMQAGNDLTMQKIQPFTSCR